MKHLQSWKRIYLVANYYLPKSFVGPGPVKRTYISFSTYNHECKLSFKQNVNIFNVVPYENCYGGRLRVQKYDILSEEPGLPKCKNTACILLKQHFHEMMATTKY